MDLENEIETKNFFFKHPVTENKIYIVIDGCYVLKLLRNTIATENLIDDNGLVISWRHLEKLV